MKHLEFSIGKLQGRHPINLTMASVVIFLAFSACSVNSIDDMEPAGFNKSISTHDNGQFTLVEDNARANGFANGPSESGFFVWRHEEVPFGVTLIDDNSNLVATITWPDQLPGFCGGGFPEELLNFQTILVNNPQGAYIEFVTGEVQARVFEGPLSTTDFSGWCPFFADGPVLAEGTVEYNDSWIEVNNNAVNFTWNVNAHGDLLSPEGDTKRLAARVTFKWNVDEDLNTLLDVVQTVSVRLN